MHPFYEDYYERLKDQYDEMAKLIAGVSDEDLDWTPAPETNSLNVLATHTMGSTRYWVGDIAGNVPAPRDRDAEFQISGLSETELKQRIQAALDDLHGILENMTLDDLSVERPSPRHDRNFTVPWALFHALEHIGQHIGHMQITRQLIDQK